MTESDPGSVPDLDTLSLDERYGLSSKSASEVYLPGARRKSKKRQAKLNRSGSIEASPAMVSSGDAAASDGENLSNGDTPAKTGKSRIRLWDHFLSKTRRIRIRKPRESSSSGPRSPTDEASKLQARSSSHPNIPISSDKEKLRSRPISVSSPDESNKTFPSGPSKDRWKDYGIDDDDDPVDKASNKRDDDGNEEDDEDEETHAQSRRSSTQERRAVFKRAPGLNISTRTKSSSSNDDLNDSVHDPSHSTPSTSVAPRSRAGRRFFHRQTPDDGYRSSQDVSNISSGNVDKVSRLPPSGHRKSMSKDRNNSTGSTPRRDDVIQEPRALSREDVFCEDSLSRSENGLRNSKEDLVEEEVLQPDGAEETEQDGDGVPVLERSDLPVSKSVDSLLAVASSISLPAHAVLRTDSKAPPLAEQTTLASGGISPSGHAIRRHSYDNALQRDTSEEFFDCSEDYRQEVVSDGDVTASSSSEASPRHYRGQWGKPHSYVQRLPDIVGLAREVNSARVGAVSRGCSSSRDSLESDLDIDSQAFSIYSDDAANSLPGSPIIKVDRFCQQVGNWMSLSVLWYPDYP